MTKLYLLISLLCFALSWCHPGSEQCSYDKTREDHEFLDIEEDMSSTEGGEDRVLASTSYSNLRIYPYYGYLESSSSGSSPTYNAYLMNDLIPPVVSYWSAALKVKYPVVGNLKLSTSVTSVCGQSVPSILHTTGVPADLFMIYNTYQTENFVAYSGVCYAASGSKRSIVARTMINSGRLINPKGDPVKHEKNVYTILHELTHLLGFDNNQFNYFLDANGNKLTGHIKKVSVAGKTRTVLDLAPLTPKLRDYYGCSTLPGAIMENDGGSGTALSHFEQKYFLWEMMCSYDSFGRRVSEFTLAFLEGTGWYVPNYSYAEPYFYGKGQGCSYMSSTCSTSGTPKYDEYCTGSNRGCAPEGRGGGYCSGNPLIENCKAVEPYDDYDCDSSYAGDYARLPELQVFGRGAGSKCFTGTLNTRSSTSSTSFCFKYTCVGSGSSTELEVTVGKNTVTCTEEGPKTISGYYGSVNCPDPLTFCNTVALKYCPLNCAGQGKCVNNKCQCNAGYTGIDCTMKN